MQTARTEVLRSRDGGLTWQSVQPMLAGGRYDRTTDQPRSLCLRRLTSQRKRADESFHLDLEVACGYLLFSDKRGHDVVAQSARVRQLRQRSPDDLRRQTAGELTDGRLPQGPLLLLQIALPIHRAGAASMAVSLAADSWSRRSVASTPRAACAADCTVTASPTARARIFIPKGHCALTDDRRVRRRRRQLDAHRCGEPPAARRHAGRRGRGCGRQRSPGDVLWWDDANHLPYVSVLARSLARPGPCR